MVQPRLACPEIDDFPVKETAESCSDSQKSTLFSGILAFAAGPTGEIDGTQDLQ
jgi:hypothetical protein